MRHGGIGAGAADAPIDMRGSIIFSHVRYF